METLSIIVVTLNEATHLPRLKQSIDSLRIPAGMRIETVLIDGGSADGTEAKARALTFTKVIEIPGASIPVCRNRGVQEAGGRWLAFVDGDCELSPDWVEAGLPWLRDHDPVIIGWPVSPPEDRTWVQDAWHKHWIHKNRKATAGGVIETEAFRLITTRNVLLTRSAWEAVDGFDEQLATGEDTDFVFRAYMHGVKAVAVPQLKVIHHGEPKTLGEYYRQQRWHANRRAYARIARTSGGRIGGHAPLFTAVFTAATVLAALGGVLAVLLCRPTFLILATPLLLSVAGPAGLMAWRGGSPILFFQLCVLYAAYGIARGFDLIGLSTQKSNWKTRN